MSKNYHNVDVIIRKRNNHGHRRNEDGGCLGIIIFIGIIWLLLKSCC